MVLIEVEFHGEHLWLAGTKVYIIGPEMATMPHTHTTESVSVLFNASVKGKKPDETALEECFSLYTAFTWKC